MDDNMLTEKILDSIRKGIKNAFYKDDDYKNNMSPEDIKLTESMYQILYRIKDLCDTYGYTEPITIDLVKKHKEYRIKYFNDEFPTYDVYGYSPKHESRLVITKFTVNPKKKYKLITFDGYNSYLDDFMNKEDAVDFCKCVYEILQDMLN